MRIRNAEVLKELVIVEIFGNRFDLVQVLELLLEIPRAYKRLEMFFVLLLELLF